MRRMASKLNNGHDRQIIHSHSEAILMEMESLDIEGLPDVDIDNLNEIAVSIRSRLHNPVVRNEERDERYWRCFSR